MEAPSETGIGSGDSPWRSRTRAATGRMPHWLLQLPFAPTIPLRPASPGMRGVKRASSGGRVTPVDEVETSVASAGSLDAEMAAKRSASSWATWSSALLPKRAWIPSAMRLNDSEELADFVVARLGDTAVEIARAEIVQRLAEKLDRAGQQAAEQVQHGDDGQHGEQSEKGHQAAASSGARCPCPARFMPR